LETFNETTDFFDYMDFNLRIEGLIPELLNP